MEPKKSSFFSINFPSFSCFFTLFVFAIFYRFMYKSDYQGTYGFNSFLCSCLLTVYSGGKKIPGIFAGNFSKFFLVLCVSILGLGT